MPNDVPREYLVILETGRSDKALAQLKTVADVTQMLAPRLVLVRPDADVQKRVSLLDGVVGVYDRAPAQLPADFSRAERLFISAWEARQVPKARPGEGLSWDAPGFVAPDAPRGGENKSVPGNDVKKKGDDKTGG